MVAAMALYDISTYDEAVGSTFYLNSEEDIYKIDGKLMPFPRYQGNYDKSMIFSVKNMSGLYKFSTENVYSLSMGFALTRTNVLFKLFRDNIQRLHETGILPYQLKTVRFSDYGNMKKIFTPVEIPEASYVTLNLDVLKAGFVIWLVTVVISILSFIVENIHFHIMKYLKDVQMKKDMKKSKIRLKVRKVKFDFWKRLKWWFRVNINDIKILRGNRVTKLYKLHNHKRKKERMKFLYLICKACKSFKSLRIRY